jgi:4'-phosphopantetheinyl transferase
MSHSGGLAIYALTADCEVGIDVEEVRDMSDIEEIASHNFSAAEAAQFLSISGMEAKKEAFFRCWTRKEAYIKAVGDGLYLPLDKFQVTLLPDVPARFVQIGNDPRAAAEWTLQHLDPAPRYVGAIAYQADPRVIVFHQPLDSRELLEGVRQ